MFQSGKIYTHSQGLSCCFRQHKTSSPCKYIHGYSLQVELTFERQNGGLDDRNWVMGFGDLKPVKQWLEKSYDHKCLVAHTDPALKTFQFLEKEGLIQLRIVKKVGAEGFAEEIYQHVKDWMAINHLGVKVKKVIVREHESNWASYEE